MDPDAQQLTESSETVPIRLGHLSHCFSILLLVVTAVHT